MDPLFISTLALVISVAAAYYNRRQARSAEDSAKHLLNQNSLLKGQNDLMQKQLDHNRQTQLTQLAADVGAALYSPNATELFVPILGRSAILLGEHRDIHLAIAAFKSILQGRYANGESISSEDHARLRDEHLKFMYKLILVLSGVLSEEDAQALIDNAIAAKLEK